MEKKKKKENSTEVQKPKVEGEFYNNNKTMNEGKNKKLIILIAFHSANKIDNYKGGGGKKRKKYPK